MRLVDAEQVKHIVNEYIDRTGSDIFTKFHIFEFLNEADGCKKKPVAHGHWEIAIGYDPKKSFQCSLCRMMTYENTKFCPHCGAMMDEEVQNDD